LHALPVIYSVGGVTRGCIMINPVMVSSM